MAINKHLVRVLNLFQKVAHQLRTNKYLGFCEERVRQKLVQMTQCEPHPLGYEW